MSIPEDLATLLGGSEELKASITLASLSDDTLKDFSKSLCN